MSTLSDAFRNAERHRNRLQGRVNRKILAALSAQVAAIAKLTDIPSPSTLEALIKQTDVRDMLVDIWGDVAIPFAQREENKLTGKKRKELSEMNIQAFLQAWAATRIEGIANTTKAQIRMIIAAGQAAGLGIAPIMRMLVKEMKGINRIRARMISRTEIISASNWGSLEGAKATGLNLRKIWIPAIDTRTRPDHLNMSGKPGIALNADFIVGGSPLRFPGDPKGPAEQVINCRCAVAHQVV